MPHAHDDAIGWRAFDGEMTLADLPHAQRIVQRERMRHARLIDFRRDDPHLLGKTARDFQTGREPWRMNAVVVRDENTHYDRSITLSPPIYCASAAGTAIEPFSCWQVSITAITATTTFTPEPSSGCTLLTPSLAR